MIDYEVPFYSNTADDTHCFQAALKMILKYFRPDQEYSWQRLDSVTAKVEGMWTWPYAGMLWLQENGFEVRNIALMDSDRFAREGYPYLVEFYGEERARANKEHSDLEQEQRFAKKFVSEVATEVRIPSVEDITALLNDGYLVGCNVNSRSLNDKPGYVGHFVVIKGYNDTELVLHDPGLPAIENRKVDFAAFNAAWSFPNDDARNVVAIRTRNNLAER